MNLETGATQRPGHRGAVVGTSAVVYPAAGLVPYAKQGGAKVIEINTDETPFTNMVDCALCGPAGMLVPQLVG
jgi:NAD-dependent SIR2 family protein deacetylase